MASTRTSTVRRARPRRAPPLEAPRDVNADIASLLFDMAEAHESAGGRQGYMRAAWTVLELDRPIDEAQTERIPNIGPATLRIIAEYVETGASATVDRAIARSNRAAKIAELGRLRKRFLSRAATNAILADRRGPAVTRDEYRGDFQMHSEWSDGSLSLEDLCERLIARGYRCSAVTDHSYGLWIARGISMDDVREQRAEIQRLNRRHAGRFRLFHGIETSIRGDGSLDMEPHERRETELVVAAPHSELRKEEDQTARMVRAVSASGVHVLGHPTGRKYHMRAGVSARWADVFAVAARRSVAIEIDGSLDRQDIDYALARQALEAGCLFALDSDAHADHELAYTDYAIAHARLAGIPAERVINCWSDEKLLEWMEKLQKGS